MLSVLTNRLRTGRVQGHLSLVAGKDVSLYLPKVMYRDFFLELQRQAIIQDRGLWDGCREKILARPGGQIGGKVIGSKRSKIYDLPDGEFYDRVGKNNGVYFDSMEQAEQAGYWQSKR